MVVAHRAWVRVGVTGLVVALIGGCAPKPSVISGRLADGEEYSIARCNFSRGFRNVRPDDHIPFAFSVAKDAPWCVDGFNLANIGGHGGEGGFRSQHGDVELGGNIVIAYRPDPGFVGHDEFEVSTGMEGGTLTFHASVEVGP